MTTLNGLPRSWESFIQGICSRRKLTKFHRLWEECTKEEARLIAREEKTREYDNKALEFHALKDYEPTEKRTREYSLSDDEYVF